MLRRCALQVLCDLVMASGPGGAVSPLLAKDARFLRPFLHTELWPSVEWVFIWVKNGELTLFVKFEMYIYIYVSQYIYIYNIVD